jgi:hypothetical protein
LGLQPPEPQPPEPQPPEPHPANLMLVVDKTPERLRSDGRTQRIISNLNLLVDTFVVIGGNKQRVSRPSTSLGRLSDLDSRIFEEGEKHTIT